jgi:hypothetical protein
VIVSMHVATGAAAGAAAGTRRRALLLGTVLHALGDRIPHHDIASRRFEIVAGALEVVALALARGPLDPAVIGALAASAPATAARTSAVTATEPPEASARSRAIATALALESEPPPAHVTLYTRPGGKGIGIHTRAELERLSSPLDAAPFAWPPGH